MILGRNRFSRDHALRAREGVRKSYAVLSMRVVSSTGRLVARQLLQAPGASRQSRCWEDCPRPRSMAPALPLGLFALGRMGRLAVASLLRVVASLLRGMGLAVLRPEPRRQLLYGMGPPGSVEVGADHPMASFDAQVVPVQEVVVWEADDQVDAQARIEAELYRLEPW